MSEIRIVSIFQTLRPCLKCGTEFYPPKRPDRLILDYCSATCEKAAGLRPMRRASQPPAPSPPRIRVVPRATAPKHVRRPVHVKRTQFGSNLIRLRLAAGWTQRDLARRIGARHQQVVSFWENERCEPTAGNLRKLADALGVTMDDLWRGDARDGARRGEEAAS